MQTILTAFRFALLMMVLSGLAYPFTVTALGQLAFPNEANGSLIKSQNGTLIGSRLIGQNFTRPEYFHPRPSANSYDAANSGGSNLGVTSRKLVDRIVTDAHTYGGTNHSEKAVPVDAVTTSASGLDPHISVANALAQAPRIAAVRQLPLQTVTKLVTKAKESALAETPYVNVLNLNLALDERTKLSR